MVIQLQADLKKNYLLMQKLTVFCYTLMCIFYIKKQICKMMLANSLGSTYPIYTDTGQSIGFF